ncbi:MAG TPA: hypothetical protein VFI34_08665 [Candidatus Limnocylindrales bacterium]|nr:hypothetical protein [Candidatus Limnocylindrales bacterium]
MFSTNDLFVRALIDERLAAAAAERRAAKRSTSSHVMARIDAAIKSAWSLLSGPAERPSTPTLINYPFRG